MKITEIAFSGYPVTDMARARSFYEGVLGLTFARAWGPAENPHWVEFDIGTGCLALISGDADWPPANGGPAIALEVDDFEGLVAKLRDHGVKFLWEPSEHGACWMAVVLDPEGNRLVIHHQKA